MPSPPNSAKVTILLSVLAAVAVAAMVVTGIRGGGEPVTPDGAEAASVVPTAGPAKRDATETVQSAEAAIAASEARNAQYAAAGARGDATGAAADLLRARASLDERIAGAQEGEEGEERRILEEVRKEADTAIFAGPLHESAKAAREEADSHYAADRHTEAEAAYRKAALTLATMLADLGNTESRVQADHARAAARAKAIETREFLAASKLDDAELAAALASLETAEKAHVRGAWEESRGLHEVAGKEFTEVVAAAHRAVAEREAAFAARSEANVARLAWAAEAKGQSTPDPGAESLRAAELALSSGQFVAAAESYAGATQGYEAERSKLVARAPAIAARESAAKAGLEWASVATEDKRTDRGGAHMALGDAADAAGVYQEAIAAYTVAESAYLCGIAEVAARAARGSWISYAKKQGLRASDSAKTADGRWKGGVTAVEAEEFKGATTEFVAAEALFREAVEGGKAAVKKVRTARESASAARAEWRGALSGLGVSAGDAARGAETAFARAEKSGANDADAAVRAYGEAAAAYRKLKVDALFTSIDLGRGVRLDMVRIRRGSFRMGAQRGETFEGPVHDVEITKSFWLARTEVTQAQWQAVMGSNPSGMKGADLPVENVGWEDCQEFVKRLNAKVPGGAFRLPTEAEWEYACRAGSTRDYCFGDDTAQIAEYAWCAENARGTLHPVGKKKPNAWGLYDMHGNVWEWCEDWWGDYGPEKALDPKGPARGEMRIRRGGGYDNPGMPSRSASRGGCTLECRHANLGLRCARSAD